MTKVSTNWKTLSQKNLVKNKFMEIWDDEVQQPNGRISHYYVRRKPPFSIVIPFDGKKYHLCRQYRYTVGSISLEFPMGYVEGKNPHDSAVIELEEEMGITAGNMEELGNYWVGTGHTNQIAYVFLATHLTFGKPKPEEGEFFEYEEYSFDEIKQLIADRKILDAHTIVAFHYLEDLHRNK